MGIAVQAFGGTSVVDAEAICRLAAIAQATRDRGNRPALVVSPMGGVTGALFGLAETTARGGGPAEGVTPDGGHRLGQRRAAELAPRGLCSDRTGAIRRVGRRSPGDGRRRRAPQAALIGDRTDVAIRAMITPLVEAGCVLRRSGVVCAMIDERSTTLDLGRSDYSAAVLGAGSGRSRCGLMSTGCRPPTRA